MGLARSEYVNFPLLTITLLYVALRVHPLNAKASFVDNDVEFLRNGRLEFSTF
jgi:hypothetical protein